MRRSKTLRVPVLAIAFLTFGLACGLPPRLARYYPFAEPICLEAPYWPPPSSFQESDLVGTWEAKYHLGVDRLTIWADGTFKEVYEDHYEPDYVYETPWNEWWLERFPDGRIGIHLDGARYYVDGVRIAERDGLGPPTCPTSAPGCTGKPFPLPHNFVDPFTREYVHMPGELVLNVRVDSSGEVLLHHMFYHADAGFAISGCWRDHFRRVETP